MRVEAEARGLGPELGLVRSGARDEEAHAADAADDARERLERELEALLVDEPAREQHEPLVGGGVLGAKRREVVTGRRSSGSIPFGITVTASSSTPNTSATWPRM